MSEEQGMEGQRAFQIAMRYSSTQDAQGVPIIASPKEFIERLAEHHEGDKDGPGFCPNTFSGRRRVADVETRTMIGFDVERIGSGPNPPSPQAMAARIRAKGWEGVVYTSWSSTPENPRYRVVLSLDEPFRYGGTDTERARAMGLDRHMLLIIANRLEITDVIDRTKLNPASFFFFGRHPKGGDYFSSVIEGKAIILAGLLRVAEENLEVEHQAREYAEKESLSRRATASGPRQNSKLGLSGPTEFDGSISVIDALRKVLPSFERFLASKGYRFFPGFGGASGRWLHPNSTTGEPGVTLITGDDGNVRYFSWHGCDVLEAERNTFGAKSHDIVDVVIAWDYGTSDEDRRRGLKDLAQKHGIGRDKPQAQAASDDEWGSDDDGKPRPQNQIGPIEIVPWAKLPRTTVQWLVQDLLPAGGFVALYGQPGSFKSFVALYLAASIATGTPAFGRPVRQGATLYIAGEGRAGLRKRRDALVYRYALEGQDVPVHFIRAQLDFRSTNADVDAVILALKELNLAPTLVVVDTLARAFAGGNENASEDMGAFIRQIGRLQEGLDHPAVIVVHHSGKDEAKGMRGHSSIFGAIDTELEVTRKPDERLRGVMNVTKQKDGEDDMSLRYTLDLVPLGICRSLDGDTSLAVVPDVDEFGGMDQERRDVGAGAGRAARQPSAAARRPPAGMKLFMDCLNYAMGEHGQDVRPFMDGPLVRAVNKEDVRRYYYQRRADADDEDANDKKRQAFHRHIKSGEDAKLIMSGVVNGEIWFWLP